MTRAAKEKPVKQPPTNVELPESLRFDSRFLFNRELSWLEFNRRVLEEAFDEATPLLERLKFLSIFSTNLDEFFMIRVSALKEQVEERISELSSDGMSATEQLRQICERLRPMLDQQLACLQKEILPRLSLAGIEICAYKNLTKPERQRLDEYFLKNVFPVLTPQAVDASHPFPYVSNLSLNLCLMVEPERNTNKGLKNLFNQKRFARIKLPPNLPRLIPIDDDGTRFTLVGELVAANVRHLFPNMKTGKSFLFRVTRDADIELRQDEAGDLLRSMERQLHRRRFGDAVRLEVAAAMPEKMVEYLTQAIELTEQDVYRIDGFLSIPDLMTLYGLSRAELKDKPITPTVPLLLQAPKNIFDVLKKADVLLHHPFTAYSTVTNFINQAAEDADVQAIKICLYRTGKDSPIVQSLMRASERGKQVAALVELKARFDEENNIEWARKLENEGVHVVYGVGSLKTHSKVTLVVRREKDGLRRYVHIATGNYNPTTSRLYTDLGLLTADEEIGADATDLFNFLTGYSHQTEYRKLFVAPVNLREKTLELIRREAEHSRQGKLGRIIVKINSLTDVGMIHELYLASQAGVKIDLIVRGVCSLRPQTQGFSENICVTSVVGRFLEHSRIFYFANDGNEEAYIGSADWMSRNLDRRVEVMTPILDEKIRHEIKEGILEVYLRDTVNARLLNADGSYEKIPPGKDELPFAAQMFFAGGL